jgi:hypothetical protein
MTDHFVGEALLFCCYALANDGGQEGRPIESGNGFVTAQSAVPLLATGKHILVDV